MMVYACLFLCLAKQIKNGWLLRAKKGGYGNLGKDEKYGKRMQVSFRITEVAKDRLEQVSRMFNKAVLYRDLGIFSEPLDRRKRSWRQKKRKENLEDF